MLIEFSVANYRSFRERQTFSMVAAPRLRKKENTFLPEVAGEKLPALLKVAAIYGPNASGKSNLLAALDVVATIANRKPTSTHVNLPVTPFRFDKELATEPSRFEIHFVRDGCRYQFELAATAQRILEERLTAFPRGRESLMYERNHWKTADEYKFGAGLEGGRDVHETWRKLTGPRTLFISQAVANSSEELVQLKRPFQWISEGISVINGMQGWAGASRKLAHDNAVLASDISRFLQDIDVPVTKIRADEASASLDAEKRFEATEPVLNKTILTHKTALGEADFDFAEESEGTKNLIGFWLPWSFLGQSGNSMFQALVVDELDSSLHPEIVATLVRRHIGVDRPAQLIFTTHDTHLMDTGLLRRDQFWLTERDANGATQLRSIHDFEGREGEDIEKRYYEGRYRALPILRKR